MEFTDVGKHCEYVGCGQQDFLPYMCDCCKKRLCAEHRKYEAHNCTGNAIKNMTSIDCPVCGKSIKFDESQDINVLWEYHFANVCVQKPPPVVQKLKCAKKSCSTTLGPSNTFKCPKCLKSVCMSHRIAEDHECESLLRRPAGVTTQQKESSVLLSRLDKNTSTKNTTKANQQSISGTRVVSGKSANGSGAAKGKPATVSTVDLTNTLKGTAHRRQQQQQQSNGSSSSTITNTNGHNNSNQSAQKGTVAAVPVLDGSSSSSSREYGEVAILQCPFCCDFLELTGDSAALMRHVDTCSANPDSSHHTLQQQQQLHVETTSQSHSHYPGNVAVAAASASGREVIALVIDFTLSLNHISCRTGLSGVSEPVRRCHRPGEPL